MSKLTPKTYTTQRIDDEYGSIELDTSDDGRVRRTTWDLGGNVLDNSGWLDRGTARWHNAVQGFAYDPVNEVK